MEILLTPSADPHTRHWLGGTGIVLQSESNFSWFNQMQKHARISNKRNVQRQIIALFWITSFNVSEICDLVGLILQADVAFLFCCLTFLLSLVKGPAGNIFSSNPGQH